MMFKYIIPLLILSLLSYKISSAQHPGIEETKISLKLTDASLTDFIKAIEAVTPFKFLANARDVENEVHINIDISNEPLKKVLDTVLNQRRFEYRQTGANIILKKLVDVNSSPSKKRNAYSLHGAIRSEKSGEMMIGATIIVSGTTIGTQSNTYGFYSLTLPPGNYLLQVSAIGMKTEQVQVNLDADRLLNIHMKDEVINLESVVVTATTTGRSLTNPQMSVDRINVQQVRDLPVLFGERDIMKTIQLLPGVKSAGEGNSGFYVRGGAADQNLILLDDAPVYNASHLLGFFSTFNSDAIKNVTLYKGGMPANYGGRLSSVVDINMNDGNNQEFGVNGGIGLIASRLNIEGPIQKDKSSYLLSGRRTYADLFLQLLGDSSLRKTRLYFYDLNAKMNYTIGEKDRLYISGYFGRDVLSQDRLAGINWGNTTATLRWNHIFHNKLFSNTSLIYSNYDYRISINSGVTRFGILSRIRDWNVKEELQWYMNTRNTITIGVNSIYHTIKPGEISISRESGNLSQGLPDRYSLENALYASNYWKINSRWHVTYGLRLTAFSILGEGDYYNVNTLGEVTDTLRYSKGEVVKTYINPEPRIAISFRLNNFSSLKWSYTRNTQNLHLISNSTSASPTDKWVASTNSIKPEIADQFAAGYYKDLMNGKYELTLEAYYKNMQNQIDYRNGAQVFSNDAIETQLLYGKGRAYGIEWLLKRKAGKFSGWLSYTLSKTERRIIGINNNKWYNARQDRTHDIAIVGIYKLNSKWTLSANWIFYTGDAVTYPSGKYKVDEEIYFYYSERNGYRLPDYHRLDLGATLQLKKRKFKSSELNFSLFNAYGRANAYQVSFQESEDHPEKTEAVKISLFTFVPSISYNFKF